MRIPVLDFVPSGSLAELMEKRERLACEGFIVEHLPGNDYVHVFWLGGEREWKVGDCLKELQKLSRR